MRIKHWLWGAAAAALLTIPFWGQINRDSSDAPGRLEADRLQSARSVHDERISKTSIMRSDIKLTEELCRSQCRMDVSEAAKHRTNLEQLRKAKHHFLALAHIEDGQVSASAGTPPAADEEAARHWRQAAIAVSSGRAYMSPGIEGKDGETSFVLGEPGGTHSDGVIGYVRQDLLTHVRRHQERNLRLIEFPDEDNRFGIRAINPDTGQEEDVDTPEENQGISHYLRNEVVVRFAYPPTDLELRRMMNDTESVLRNRMNEVFVFESRARSMRELLDFFQDQNIVYAEPHYMYVTNEQQEPVTPNDELYRRYQWNFPAISVPSGWTLSRGTEEVIVAVVDTGADLDHPDLAGHLVDGYNTVDPESPPEDDVGHGTHVAGVVAALTDNNEGVAGMTWYNPVMPVKALDSTGMGSTYSVAKGIIWAVDHGAKVINLSLGNYAGASFLHDAIRYAFNHDVVIIAATGNDSTAEPGFPAAYPEVLAVSATNQHGELASFSNYGSYIDVVAPGEQIASTYTDHQYAALSGTSMASPHVAALAALIRSVNPQLTNVEVYDVLRRSAIDLGESGRDSHYGYGQIDAARALQLATGKAPQEAAAEGGRKLDSGGSLLEQLLRSIFGVNK